MRHILPALCNVPVQRGLPGTPAGPCGARPKTIVMEQVEGTDRWLLFVMCRRHEKAAVRNGLDYIKTPRPRGR